ncbi:hypothetical protein RFI_06557 [Reticulomyxa filosa]|uniref:Uncharacterized protein n=1 Tax=Reticulomyxa filosa TaxID=46433 RepID=X6NZ57_RETFI|nr:hypothetical protein RFI_06557 [Reticulomyxa filosa]|eukprot:ETO30562.1 hypothetical protein RFI_06557 [Reticulomyxa filosa]
MVQMDCRKKKSTTYMLPQTSLCWCLTSIIEPEIVKHEKEKTILILLELKNELKNCDSTTTNKNMKRVQKQFLEKDPLITLFYSINQNWFRKYINDNRVIPIE